MRVDASDQLNIHLPFQQAILCDNAFSLYIRVTFPVTMQPGGRPDTPGDP